MKKLFSFAHFELVGFQEIERKFNITKSQKVDALLSLPNAACANRI